MNTFVKKIFLLNNSLISYLSRYQNNKIILFILILFFFSLVFLLNLTYPLYADDWGYTFMTGSELTQKISGFDDILYSQYNHYFEHGGRTVVHIIAETLLLIGGKTCDFLNGLAYILFVWFIYRIANINKDINVSLFFMINIFIWFFQPAFSQTILWITGSANYLWGSLVIISFLFVYVKQFMNPIQESPSPFKLPLMFLFGILAGWTSENAAFGMIIILLLIIIYLKKKNNKIFYWMIGGLLGVLIGYIFMIVAPGNFVRYDQSLDQLPLGRQSSGLFFYLTRLLPVIGDFYKFAFPLLFIYIFCIITYFYFTSNINSKVVYLSLIFLIGAIVSDLIMVASPEFPPRAWFGIITYMIVAIGILYANIDADNDYIFKIKLLICIFTGISFILSFQRGYKDLYKINKIFVEREQIIDQQKDKEHFDFVVTETISPQTGFPMIDEIPSDSTHWINMFYIRYHNIKSFKIEK